MLFRALLRARTLLALTALGSGACLQAGPVDDPTPQPDAAVDAVPPPLDVSNTPCANGGAGRLRVSVSLAPTLATRPADVWLALACGDSPDPVRIVRWDGSATQTLDGFGPGTWRVYASTFVTPGAWSTTATIGSGVATAAVSLTLSGDGSLLAQTDTATASADAGAPSDAGALDATPPDDLPLPARDAAVEDAPSRDASVSDASVSDASVSDASASDASASDASVSDASVAPPVWSTRVALRDATTGASLGSATVTAWARDTDRLEVRVLAQNLCGQSGCAPLALHSVEARALDGSTPVGFARGTFATTALEYGASTMTVPSLFLRGAVPDATHPLQVAVFSSTTAVPRSAAARTP